MRVEGVHEADELACGDPREDDRPGPGRVGAVDDVDIHADVHRIDSIGHVRGGKPGQGLAQHVRSESQSPHRELPARGSIERGRLGRRSNDVEERDCAGRRRRRTKRLQLIAGNGGRQPDDRCDVSPYLESEPGTEHGVEDVPRL